MEISFYRKLSATAVITMVIACNPFQNVKDAVDAVEAKQKSDSILNEFNRVNEGLKELNHAKSFTVNPDSIPGLLDSLLSDTTAGVGAFKRR